MTCVNIEKLILKKELHCPPLREIADVLKNGLSKNFTFVETDVMDCPNLKELPFSLTSSGLCGKPILLDVGGPPYLLPLVQRDKIYDMLDIYKTTRLNPCFIIGAGAGPWPYIGVNCEGIYNLTIKDGKANNKSHTVKVNTETDGFFAQVLPDDETRFALLANLFCCEGKPGKVLKVHCKVRSGEKDFISSIRSVLAEHYKTNAVGLGGAFLIKNGKVKQHVMPDFSTTSITSDDGVNNWLKFYEMSAPLVAVGTLISSDLDLDLRVQHFHSFSQHGEGGHYHYDTTPNDVEYVGYFSIAENIYRIDKPVDTHKVGRD